MLRHRPVAMFFCGLAAVTLVMSRYVYVPPFLYFGYALTWSIILFGGCYFIGWHYFLPSVCGLQTNEKVVALTFDDGPAPSTSAVLDILNEKKVEVAFFCIGRNIAGRERVLERAIAEGHLIGNHSFSHHPLFDLFRSRKMRDDVNAMAALTNHITGLRPVFFRPPFGVTNPTVANIVKSEGYLSIGWNLRSYDTMQKNQDKLRKKIRRGLKPGGIVLLHDTVPVTVEALPLIIDDIRAAGYRLVRLDKMCNLTPYA